MNSGIIAIGAHPDDIELGCGASIAKLSNEGFNIFAIVLSHGAKGNPFKQNRIKETSKALKLLGVKKTFILDFIDTQLSLQLNEIISALEDVLRQVSTECTIDRIYTMFKDDSHQDHRAAFDASIVAFRTIKQILCYETPSSRAFFNPQIFQNFDETFLIKKIDSLKLHESQIHKNYMCANLIRSTAVFRGQQAGFQLGEGFVPYKIVL